jgi:hypothetical protein
MPTECRQLRILFYPSSLDPPDLEGMELQVATSPISCLCMAIEESIDLIVVAFCNNTLKERDALVELCAALRSNRCTKSIPLLCLVPSKHRALLERLQRAGVIHAMFFEKEEINLGISIEKFLQYLPGTFTTEEALIGLCPYIDYIPISRHQEILFCVAYRSRLVLGPYRLNLYCHSRNHVNCSYYAHPKIGKKEIQQMRQLSDHTAL